MYIDDTLIAHAINLDKLSVKLLPTLGPWGKMASCGLGIPGSWTTLEHRLRDIRDQTAHIGMKLNEKKN